MLADALLARLDERVMDLPPSRVQYPGPGYCHNDQFWTADGSRPVMDQFVTLESFLVFNVLQIMDQEVRDFFEVPYSVVRQLLYPFVHFAVQYSAVQFRCQWHSCIEENFQHGLVTVIEERKLAEASKNSQITKQNLKNIIWQRPPGN